MNIADAASSHPSIASGDGLGGIGILFIAIAGVFFLLALRRWVQGPPKHDPTEPVHGHRRRHRHRR